ncbi:OprO/OprP family phosphate-selective porin [Roseiterribacter gracilis]|uniref:Porin n=1 Tax=Roseiterribacter gracilis TaxID=2812848 RepID=A0A8S8XH26_9PROT|nr:porin [Rhodospirillales bacterium TMPK1]
MTRSGKVALAALLLASPLAAHAAPGSGDDIATLRQQMQAMQKRLDAMEAAEKQRVAAAAQVKTEAMKPTDVVASLPNGRPTLSTRDGEFTFQMFGRVHFDAASYFDQKKGTQDLNSGTNARRIYWGVQGKFARDWEYELSVNAGGSGNDGPVNLLDARLTYAGLPGVKIDIGYINPFLNLEEATSSNDIVFFERAAQSNIIEGLAGTDGRSAIGVRSNGDRWFAHSYLTGSAANNNPNGNSGDEQLAVIGRGVFLPYKSDRGVIHVGVNGTYVFQTPQLNTPGGKRVLNYSERPELRVDGTQFLNTSNNNATGGSYNIDRAYEYGLEFLAIYDALHLQGQYSRFGLDTRDITVPGSAAKISPNVEFSGWYAQASYMLTGEQKPYNIGTGAPGPLTPIRPFSLSEGGWGAWEVGLRYSTVNLNDASQGFIVNGGRQRVWTAALNWYVNRNVRFLFDYINGDVDKHAFGTNAQTGVAFQAIATRAQFNF